MFGEPVTRLRHVQDGVDRYGNPVYVWAEVELPVGGAFDPGGSREPVEVGREPVITQPKLYFTEPVDLTAGDRVRVRGVEFDVLGTPAEWSSPWSGAVRGVVVEVKVVAG